MWCSKMAARWSGKDGDLNAGSGDFLVSSSLDEFVLRQHGVHGGEMDTQSCVDHSILAIFEDSSVTSEDKCQVEEESEHLLSALTEMLDSVEDDDGTSSPFDTLPDTKLLTHMEREDNSLELSLAERLRPRCKSTDANYALKIEGDKEHERKKGGNSPQKMFKHQSESLSYSKNRKTEPEVEVFTSSTLVNLVKIMHSYCLKLHVEEEGEKLKRDHTLFSHEEVWKYERPSEESDEEINVVSDDEVTVKETKDRKEEDNGKLLKSVLLNGISSKAPPSREKKRVSFGPVQVASFNEPEDTERLNGKNLTSQFVSKALENPASPALESKRLSSDGKTKTEVSPPRGETKARSLSLQQYRQLRQKRQPLVEKQGNYTTKWPSVPEPPKELTPIFCLQGQVQISCRPKAANSYPDVKSYTQRSQTSVYKTQHTPRPQPSEANPYSCHSRLMRPGHELKDTAGPVQSVSTNTDVPGPESKRSPVKKVTALTVDPPNPVLLPLPASRTPSPPTHHSSTESTADLLNKDSNRLNAMHFQNVSSGPALQQQPSSFKPKPEVSQHKTDTVNKCGETALVISEPKTSPSPSLTPAPTDAPTPFKETVAEVSCTDSSPEKLSPTQQSATDDSGIEAADVTSLLEQFEETQAKEGRVEPKLVSATSSTNRQTDENLDRTSRHFLMPHVETHPPSSTSDSNRSQTNLRDPRIPPSESVEIPEPLGTEIILSTERDLPARRKNPPLKAIQIIDPRPLPPRKTHTNLPELAAAHTYTHITSDHDYCMPVDCTLSSTTQGSSPAAGCKNQISPGGANASFRAASSTAKSVLQNPPEEPVSPPSNKPLSVSDIPAKEEDCRTAEQKTPQCILPTPPPSPPVRGREKRRYRRRSPRSSSRSCSSSSSSSSASRSPKRQKHHHKRSESSSCSSCSRSISRSPPRQRRWSRTRTKRSRSRSWSRSRSPSRSPSPQKCHRKWRGVYSSRESRRLRREHEIRIQKLKAIDERRVVYVGRICRSMTHDELRERFSQFGEVESVSLHFRDKGDHYAFVTFYNMGDAFAAIDNGGKLRKPNELPFEICFGGRRQFCNSDYADLDANRDSEQSPVKSRFEDLDFDSLLKQAQRGLKR